MPEISRTFISLEPVFNISENAEDKLKNQIRVSITPTVYTVTSQLAERIDIEDISELDYLDWEVPEEFFSNEEITCEGALKAFEDYNKVNLYGEALDYFNNVKHDFYED